MARRREQNDASRGIYKCIFSLSERSAKSISALPKAKENTAKVNLHSALYNCLNPKSHSPSALCFQKFITTLILVDVIFYIASTEPKFSGLPLFYYAEGVTSTIFLVEYVSRLMVCTEQRRYAKYGRIRGRLRYLCTINALLDGIATLPFFIEFVIDIQLPTLTYLRIFRLLRMTRTNSYSKAMNAVVRVFYFNQEIMKVAGLLGAYLVLFTGILMYYLRPRGEEVELIEDPNDFDSIASTMVLSLLMLTGQGGPSGHLPWYTQAVVLMTGIFSVAMFAIPASMLTWGFEAEAERLGKRAKKKAMARRRGEIHTDYTSSSTSDSESLDGYGDISTSDEEYMNIIGGEDSEEDSNREDKLLLKSLCNRLEKLETTVAETNFKLELILQKIGTAQNQMHKA
ncbi:hypothetical protein ACHAWX_007765 [Stephanocyclus meneghinianus]